MSYKAVLFDLDGTLVDTLQDIADAMNHTLKKWNLPPHPLEAYNQMVGYGMRVLVQRAVPEDRHELVDEIEAYYLPHLIEHGADKAQPYPGIPELLDALTEAKTPFAVMSNKPHESVLNVVQRRLHRWRFAQLRGVKADGIRKPDPILALNIAELMNTPASDCVFMGDTRTDMETGINAGMIPVGVTWGFRDREELLEYGAQAVIDHPMDFLALDV